jgi:DNA-binding MarR family transcriptional regulator/N-acetylglutamate synthase-like GNAT family acetyltransferase
MPINELERRVEVIRAFNRFYTGKIGVLGDRYLKGPFSLAEARVLYELAHRQLSTASELAKELRLDAGYLSRILRGFRKRGLLGMTASEVDGRKRQLRLTAEGRRAFARIDARAREDMGAMLADLTLEAQHRLVGSMQTIAGLLWPTPAPSSACFLRHHRPGDMGWVVHRHGVLYAQEYGWDERFEAIVAEIVAEFLKNYDPKRERCWIAEQDGGTIGSVFLVKQTDSTAKLRLLLVEPAARASGLGTRLVDECVRFARTSGYQKITLWTNHVLHAARSIYAKAGFRLVKEEPHNLFGEGLIGQTWEFEL